MYEQMQNLLTLAACIVFWIAIISIWLELLFKLIPPAPKANTIPDFAYQETKQLFAANTGYLDREVLTKSRVSIF
jgi:hypothetical protein